MSEKRGKSGHLFGKLRTNNRKIDFRTRHIVEQVGEKILGYETDDFDDLRVGQARRVSPRQILVGHMTALDRNPGGKMDSRIRLRLRGPAASGERNFFGREFRQIEADKAMCRQAIIAAIDLRHCQRDPGPGPDVQRLAERAAELDEAGQRSRCQGQSAKRIRYLAQLLFDGIQDRELRHRRLLGRWDGNSRHDRLLEGIRVGCTEGDGNSRKTR